LQDELGVIYESYIDLLNTPASDELKAEKQVLVTPHPTNIGGVVVHVVNIDCLDVILKANACLDAYTCNPVA
jgi:hypothetical protein